MREVSERSSSALSKPAFVLTVAAVVALTVTIAITLLVQSASQPSMVTADTAAAPAGGPASAPRSGGFIKIEGIDGESNDKFHEDWIEILSVSQSIKRPFDSGSGLSTGVAAFGDITIVKEIDKATPKLQSAIATGSAIPEITLELTALFGSNEDPYLKYVLTNVKVSNHRISGSAVGTNRPTEVVTLKFDQINVTYRELDDTGRNSGNVEFGWNVVKNGPN